MTTRPNVSRVWASNAPSSAVQDPDTKVPNKVAKGWESEIPPHEWFNWIQNRNDLMKKALVERGIAQWGAEIQYAKGALAFLDDDGKVYVAKVSNKGQKPVAAPNAYWARSAISITEEDIARIQTDLNTHKSNKSNPHQVTAAQIGAYDKGETDGMVADVEKDITDHTRDTSNPHKVTALQVGAVPDTGGVYTGKVTFQDTHTDFGDNGHVISDASGTYLAHGSDALGVRRNVPVFNSENILYDGNYMEYKLKTEPLYRLPSPDFFMPLTSDVNIYEGCGLATYTRPNRSQYTNKQGNVVVAEVDVPRFEAAGYKSDNGDNLYVGGLDAFCNCDLTVSTRFRLNSLSGTKYLFSIDQFQVRVIGSKLTVGDVSVEVKQGIDYTIVIINADSGLSVYLNGVLAGTGKKIAYNVDNLLFIGNTHNGFYLNGNMKSFKVWYSKLTPEQVSTI